MFILKVEEPDYNEMERIQKSWTVMKTEDSETGDSMENESRTFP
jgi:hypothetical protein